MKKSILILFLYLLAVIQGANVQAQNLVLNPSFEDHYDCFFGEGAIDKSIFWHTANQSPEYFNICSWDSGFIIPVNLWGYQIPKSGNAYAAFGTYARYSVWYNAHEHIRGTLKNQLVVGQKYYVSFYVSLAVNAFNLHCATNNIGAWFTTFPYLYIFPDSVFPSPVYNQAQINHIDIVSDTINWTRIFGSFIADSAYTFIIIGNFMDDNLTDTLMIDLVQNYCQAGYYLDDICVSTDSVFAYNYTYDELTKNKTTSAIEVYPNLVKNIVSIKTDGHYAVSISVLNIFGKRVLLEENLTKEFSQIDLSNLVAGLYILVVETKKEKQTFKLLKQ